MLQKTIPASKMSIFLKSGIDAKKKKTEELTFKDIRSRQADVTDVADVTDDKVC